MQSYWSRVLSQRIRRRRVLAGMGATGLGAVLLAACGGDDDDGGAADSASPTEPAGATDTNGGGGGEPVKDRVVISLPYTGDEFNDPRWNNAGSTWQIRPQWDTLIALDRNSGERTGYLASEWEVRPDDLQVTMRLRQGVTMHDGNTMTSEDAAFSLEYGDDLTNHPISASGYMNDLIGPLETPSQEDLVINLNKPDAQIFSLFMGDLYTYWMVYSKAALEARGSLNELVALEESMVAGTGPWQYVSRTPSENLIFQRFEDHYRKVPDFKELEFRIINEDSTRLASLLAGEVDMTLLPPDLQETAIGRGMQRIIGKVPGNRVFLDFLGCTIGVDSQEYLHPDNPLLDLRVRKALNKAIDRPAINEAFLAGRGELMLLNHYHPTRDGWDPSWESRWEEEYGYDPAEARKLLEAAGFGSSADLGTTVYYRELSAFPQSADVLETLVGYWNDVGAGVKFETIDGATLTSLVQNQEAVNAIRMSLSSSPVDIGFDVYNGDRRGWTRGYGAGYAGMTMLETSQKYIDNLSVLDPEEYATTLQEIGEAWFVNHMGVPLFWINPEVVFNPEVVAGWEWHGSKSGVITDTEYIKAVMA